MNHTSSPFAWSIVYAHFILKSLENSDYKLLMKEIEVQVDQKKWLNKEGLPFSAKAMASWIRQLIVSLDVMTKSNKHISQQVKANELTGNVTSQWRSIRSALSTSFSIVSLA